MHARTGAAEVPVILDGTELAGHTSLDVLGPFGDLEFAALLQVFGVRRNECVATDIAHSETRGSRHLLQQQEQQQAEITQNKQQQRTTAEVESTPHETATNSQPQHSATHQPIPKKLHHHNNIQEACDKRNHCSHCTTATHLV